MRLGVVCMFEAWFGRAGLGCSVASCVCDLLCAALVTSGGS